MTSLVAPSEAEVHLWQAPLDLDALNLSALTAAVSPDERDRARRFRFERDRVRWTAGRGWLRWLVAGYLEVEPAHVSFDLDAFGKPRLAAPPMQWLRFNLAHSDGLAVFAVARDRDVGVDVERVREDLNMEWMARRFLSVRERETVSLLPSRLRVRACFEYWTRKEACLKATGFGLGVPLDELDVSLAPGDTMRVPGLDPSATQAREWSLHGFDAGLEHVAAVAVEGRAVRVPSGARYLDGSVG